MVDILALAMPQAEAPSVSGPPSTARGERASPMEDVNPMDRKHSRATAPGQSPVATIDVPRVPMELPDDEGFDDRGPSDELKSTVKSNRSKASPAGKSFSPQLAGATSESEEEGPSHCRQSEATSAARGSAAPSSRQAPSKASSAVDSREEASEAGGPGEEVNPSEGRQTEAAMAASGRESPSSQSTSSKVSSADSCPERGSAARSNVTPAWLPERAQGRSEAPPSAKNVFFDVDYPGVMKDSAPCRQLEGSSASSSGSGGSWAAPPPDRLAETCAPAGDPPLVTLREEWPVGSPRADTDAMHTSRITQTHVSFKSTATGASGLDELLRADSPGLREGEGGWMSLWRKWAEDTYGARVHVQIGFGLGFARIIWFCALAALPFLAFNFYGENMESGRYVPTFLQGTHGEYLGWTAISNMGKEQQVEGTTTSRGVTFIDAFGWGPYRAEEVGLGVSVVDAFCVCLLFVMAVLCELFIPSVSEERRYMENFCVYVDKLPRRLPGDHHASYKEMLEKHFEQLLRGEISGDDLSKVVAGSEVVSRGDTGMPEVETRRRWCGSRLCPVGYSARDGKGRLLGKVLKGRDGELQVEWRAERGTDGRYARPQRTSFRPEELLDHQMLTRAESFGTVTADAKATTVSGLSADFGTEAEPADDAQELKLVSDVTLVRDFGGQLGALRARAARGGADSGLSEAQEARQAMEAALATNHKKALARIRRSPDLPIEDRDVIGAYVVLRHRRNRKFIFDEYRLSRTWARLCQRRQLAFGGRRIRVNDPTDPSDIFWEHMDCPAYSRFLRACLAVFVKALLICVSVGFFAHARNAASGARELGSRQACLADPASASASLPNVTASRAGAACDCWSAGLSAVINDQPSGIGDSCGDWLGVQNSAASAAFVASLAPVVMNVVTMYVVNFLANFTKPRALGSTNRFIFLQTVVMQLANVAVSVVAVHADFGPGWRGWVDDSFGDWGWGSDAFPIGCGSYAALTPEWYAEVGATIVFSLAVSAVTLPMVIPLSYLIYLGFKRYWASRASSEHLRALFLRPVYNLALISAQDAVMTIACVTFSAGMPILWLVLAVYLKLSSFAKKYTFLNGSREPPHFGHSLSLMTSACTKAAVALHCAFALWVFSEPDSLPSNEKSLALGGANSVVSRLDHHSTHAPLVILVLVVAVQTIRVFATSLAITDADDPAQQPHPSDTLALGGATAKEGGAAPTGSAGAGQPLKKGGAAPTGSAGVGQPQVVPQEI